MLELNQIYNMDCMEGMAQIPDKYFELAIVSNVFKPFCGTFNFRKITSTGFKRRIFRCKKPVDLRYMNPRLTCDFRLIRNCFTKFKDTSMILNTLFVIVRTSQSIYTQVKSFGHVTIKDITDLASIKANKSKHINFSIIISLCSVFATTLYVKNVCMAILCPLRDNTWCGSSFHLNAQKVVSVIHEYIIRKALFTRKGYKPFHNNISANKVFASLANLEFVTNSHNITSSIFYHTYHGVSSAKAKAVA